MTNLIINLSLSNIIISISHEKKYFSLLTLLESKKIYKIDNNCRSGFCGICKIKILKGKVNYIINPIAYIKKNEILPCCCRIKKSIVLKL